MPYKNLLIEKSQGIALITINRPEKRNALDPQTWREVGAVVEELEADDEVQVIIFTGAGEKCFAAGSDIAQIKERSLIDGLAAPSQRALMRLEVIEKPVIAAVNGFALGGGCELSMACDIRIASENARFGQPEVNLGIMPGAGGTQRLTSLVGVGKSEGTHSDRRHHRRARGPPHRAGEPGRPGRGTAGNCAQMREKDDEQRPAGGAHRENRHQYRS